MRLVDRYILKQILLTLVFSLIAFCVIFIVVNFMEQMGNFMDSKAEIKTIVKYYLVFLPEILKILTPVSILVSCLFAIGKMSNNNEIIAIKSAGMGLYRLLVPILFIGLLLSAGQYYFNGWIVPSANEEKERISQVYLNKNKSRTSISNLAFRDTPNKNVLINFYDATSKTAHNISIETFSEISFSDDNSSAGVANSTVIASETKQSIYNSTKIATPTARNDSKENVCNNNEKNPRNKSEKKHEALSQKANSASNKQAIACKQALPVKLLSRIEAKTMTWDEEREQWILRNAITRDIIGDEKVNAKRFARLPTDLKITPRQLEKINKKTNEMTFDELEEYISLLSAGGKDVRKMEIEYHAAQALPLANFIIILFAVSFASVKKRGGLAVQIAAAMVIAFSYLVFFEISKPIGLAMNLSPIIVGWSANIIFLICGIISIFNTRT